MRFLILLLLPFCAFAVDITQSWPTMSLGKLRDGKCVAIEGVSKSIDSHYILEKAIESGAGTYCVIRPDASVKVVEDIIVPEPVEPEPTPEPEPEPTPEPVLDNGSGLIVYTRVKRTQGPVQVGELTVEHPDVWDSLPEVFNKTNFSAPGELVLRDADGNEQIIAGCERDQICVPTDAMPSPDGKTIAYAMFTAGVCGKAWPYNVPTCLLSGGVESSVHFYDVESGETTTLPVVEGKHDFSPVILPDGRTVFASTRNSFYHPHLHWITPERQIRTQLFVYDPSDGSVENWTPHEVASAMHPYVLSTGRIAYGSHWLSHNLAYWTTNGSINWPGTLANNWVLMATDLRGGDTTALLGGHRVNLPTGEGSWSTLKALHFIGERANGDVCTQNYYRYNNLGLGDVVCFTPPENPHVEGELNQFVPQPIYQAATWSRSNDEPSKKDENGYIGKIGWPEGTPDNQLILSVGRGYCNQINTNNAKTIDSRIGDQGYGCDVGLYKTTKIPSTSLSDLELIVDEPEWHEFGARVVAPRTIAQPELNNTDDGSCELVSTNAHDRETKPFKNSAFNARYFNAAQNGAELEYVDYSEMTGIAFYEVLENEKQTPDFKNVTGNRLKKLGVVDLLDDGSFKVELPCNTPYIMAGVDSEGRMLVRDQVPQSLRTGERRVCTGCHLHSKGGREYSDSLASSVEATPLLNAIDVPTYADVKPIFESKCRECHAETEALYFYGRLAWDFFQNNTMGERHKVASTGSDRRDYGLHRPLTSKYVDSMYARRSLLYWKAAGQRLDGLSDSDHDDDIDFGAEHKQVVSDAELNVIREWIDSGYTE